MADIYVNPDNADQVAVKTGDSVTAGDYFVFDINNGGYYSDGTAEKIDTWSVISP